MVVWNPWVWMRDHAPHVDVTIGRLPAGLAGAWFPGRIMLATGMTQRQRRSVLTHEIVHMWRGPAPVGTQWEPMEERAVDDAAARLLIPLDRLADALAWCGGVAGWECADELWVDQHTLDVRMAGLSDAERLVLSRRMEKVT